MARINITQSTSSIESKAISTLIMSSEWMNECRFFDDDDDERH